ncbi:permease prefix domain 1-containing protein [Clostridium kluyveri]|uniref:permease prefix domain 1-containing protein n=1 Tax=Clostridium kluyveri TaxID=1534 RepID=UPI002245691C|nr:permease prefix domain 1-containing protein [Clostridium kluyveri]UZQ50022.1 permease prefix domain 1-containing protein [Clostridium kluyveri]
MEQIDRYVNSVYRHVDGDKEEIEILKEEMRNHLLQIVEELKSEGKSDEESITIAIERFGEQTQIENELLGIFKFVNKKAKKILIAAVSFLLLALISFSTFVVGINICTKQYDKRNNEIVNIMRSYNQDDLENIDKNISVLLNKYKSKVKYVAMYHVTNGEDLWHTDLKDLEYVYPKDIQYDDMDTFNKQIITEEGVKYVSKYYQLYN